MIAIYLNKNFCLQGYARCNCNLFVGALFIKKYFILSEKFKRTVSKKIIFGIKTNNLLKATLFRKLYIFIYINEYESRDCHQELFG